MVNLNTAAADVLNGAAELISDEARFVRDYSARGFNPPEVARGEHKKVPPRPASCLPTGEHAERWNALGAIWRSALTNAPAVRVAHGFFAKTIGEDVSINRWCTANDHAAQIKALRDAAALAGAA